MRDHVTIFQSVFICVLLYIYVRVCIYIVIFVFACMSEYIKLYQCVRDASVCVCVSVRERLSLRD